MALDRVSKFHGEVRVLDRVSLEVFEGEFFTLLGPSGAGKSTILNCVTGLDQPSSGRVFLGTHDVTELPSDLRRVGMVFQDYALFPTMTVRQNVVFPLEARIQRSVLSIIRALVARREDPSIRERADRVLELVKLTGHAEKWIAQLSGGEQQRVALARALVGEPRLLCLDEPLASLDAALRRDLQTQLRSLHEHLGTTTLHVTHDQAEAFAISDRIAVIDRGRVLQIGSPKELYANPTSVFVAEFLGECNVLQIKEIAEMGCCSKIRLDGGLGTILDVQVSPYEHVIGIRPQHLVLGNVDGDSAVAVVTGVTFSGATIGIALQLVDGKKLSALVPAEQADAWRVGSRVKVSFAPKSVLILPRSSQQPAENNSATNGR